MVCCYVTLYINNQGSIMALIKCKECENNVAKNVKKCPHCGTGKNRSFFRNHPILTILGILIIISYLPVLLVDKEAVKNEQIAEQQTLKKNVQNELSKNSKNKIVKGNESSTEEIKPIYNWKYSVDEDKMRETKKLFAIIKSSNILDLGFPYNDSQMKIVVRKMDNETNVIVSLKGIFVCDYGTTCTINVKSDKNEIVQYAYNEAAHGNSDTIFIKDVKKFINMLKTSNHLIVETQLYDKGRVQYEFDVKGLEWNEQL